MTWQKLLAREGVDITTISGLDIVFYDAVWQYSGKKEELFFTYFQGKNFTHYIGVDQKEVGRFLYKKYFNSVEQIKKYEKEGEELLKKIKATTTKWKQAEKKENKRIEKVFREFREQFMQINYVYSIFSWLAIEAWQADFEQLLNGMIKRNKVEHRQDEILTAAYKPWKNTALHEIQEKIGKGISPKKIAEEYQFLRSWSVVWYRPLDEVWVRNITAQSHNDTKALTQKQLFALLNPTPEEKKFLELAPYIIFFKDWRDDLRRYHCYAWQFFWEKLSVLFSVPKDDLGYLTLLEIEDSCRLGKIDRPCIEKRKTVPLVVTAKLPELQMIMKEGPPQQYLTIINSLEKKSKQTVVSGNSAYPGKAVGKVCLIRSYHDVKKVQEGDILIANTTHPNYLPGMKKAAAFITNEGGLISHAAIVAREMKKPCIVGTKIATKCFQDGDMVEVDARSGIVRKVF